MYPNETGNTQMALELLALVVEELQKNGEFDASLTHRVKEYLKNNGVAFYDENDNDDDNEDADDGGHPDEWDHIDGYSSRYIVMNSDPSIEWTAADFD